MEIKFNETYQVTKMVTEETLAINVTSGDVEVFATPMLVAMYENAANLCLKQFLDDDSISVGTRISCTHTSPTPINKIVTVNVVIIAVEGKKITFSCNAYDDMGEISTGMHERFILNKEKFMGKVNR